MTSSLSAELTNVSNQLLNIVRNQREAIANEDVDQFEQLVSQREASQAALLATASRVAVDIEGSRAVHAIVEQIAEIDRTTLAAAKALLNGLASEMQQMKRGHSALHGYGRISANTGSANLSQIG